MQQHAPYAAGVLPFTKVGDRVLWLVAEDVRDGAFSDFGGKAERYDHDTLEGFVPTEMTAMREFLEESYGLVLADHQITNVFKSKSYVLLKGVTRAGHPYFCYVVQVPFIPHLRDVVRKLLGFFRMRNVYRSFVEKTDLRWVTTDELFGALPKRPVFASTISMNRELMDKIATEPWTDVIRSGGSR